MPYSKFNLKPVVSEEYSDGEHSRHAVAIVKKTASIQNIADLKGTKACMPEKTAVGGKLLHRLTELK